jgi:hypothetical protein
VKALFREIRAGDIRAVTARLDADDALVNATAMAPPKKDDGQSTLQVAIKAGQFGVAHLLLERGADVNFMESSDLNSDLNAWRTPVLHDAIRAAVFSTRFGRNRALPGEAPRIEIMNTAEASARAFDVLAALVARGADPGKLDSAGNPALMRAILDARQIADEPILPELVSDLERIFELLIQAGASPDWIDPRFGQSIAERFTSEPVGRFLTKR